MHYLHIRWYEINERGRYYPSHKGVALNGQQVTELFSGLTLAKEAMTKQTYFKYHIGRLCYLTFDPSQDNVSVDLRFFWYPDRVAKYPVHTKRGIKILASELEKLKDAISEAQKVWPNFEDINMCVHQNQMEVYDCAHCRTTNPYREWYEDY